MKSRIAARNLMENPEAVHAATGDERPTMAVSGSIPAWHGFFPPFSRYAAGEDFSHLKEEWTLYVNKTHFYTSLIIGLLVLGIAIFLLFRSPNF